MLPGFFVATLASMDPVQYPTIQLNGQEIALKFRLSDILALAEAGIDIWQMKAVALNSVDGIRQTVRLLKHAVAHQQPDLTESALAEMIDFGSIAKIDAALGESIKKAASQIAADLQSRAAAIPPTVPDASTVQ